MKQADGIDGTTALHTVQCPGCGRRLLVLRVVRSVMCACGTVVKSAATA